LNNINNITYLENLRFIKILVYILNKDIKIIFSTIWVTEFSYNTVKQDVEARSFIKVKYQR